jgi:hypothetical protein
MPRINRALAASLVGFLLASGAATASEHEVVISGARPASRKIAPLNKIRPQLFGPIKLTPAMKNTDGPFILIFEGVTFDPKVGSSTELYLVDAAGKDKPLVIDPHNYVGSIASMVGSPTQPIEARSEINDFKVGEEAFTPRTKLKQMDEAFIAVVVRTGKLKFKRLVIKAELPTN